jgi:hypothetical protein
LRGTINEAKSSHRPTAPTTSTPTQPRYRARRNCQGFHDHEAFGTSERPRIFVIMVTPGQAGEPQ